MMGLDFSVINWDEIQKATVETLSMLFVSGIFTFIIGLPIGIILFLTSRSESKVNGMIYAVLSFIVNILRSVPFIILIVAMLPITKAIVSTTIGVVGTIPPLVVGAAPFFARLVETSLREVDKGVIEASQAMGASTGQIIMKVLMPEALPGLLAGITITVVTLISYTAMAGMVGGGGLGALAINYGYYRYEREVMIVAVIVMILLVQILQMAGDRLVKHFTRK